MLSNLALGNYQEQAWKRLFTEDIYDIVKNESYEDSQISIQYAASNAQDFVQIRKVTDLSQSSLEKELLISITAKNKSDAAEIRQIVYEDIPIARIPLYTTSGFYIDGTQYGVKNESALAAGWYTSRNSSGAYILTHRSKGGATLIIKYGRGRFRVQIPGFKGSTGGTVDLWTFLKGISSSETFAKILKRLNTLDIFLKDYTCAQAQYVKKNIIKNAEYSEPSVEWCAEEVVHAYNKHIETNMDCAGYLHNMIFVENRLRFDSERIIRFKNMCSFAVGVGLPLAKAVRFGSTVLKRGTILTAEDLTKIKDAGIDCIYVQKDGRIFKLFEVKIEENPTMDEIISAIYYFALVIYGIGKLTIRDDFENKAIRTVSEMIGLYISRKLNALTRNIMSRFNATTATGLLKLFSTADVDLNKQKQLMDEIFSDPAYDMQDETNSLSTYQQSYRLTTQSRMLGKPSRMVHQSNLNRVCSYTTSESKSVGLNLSLSWGAQVKDGHVTYDAYTVVNGVRQPTTKGLTFLDETNKIIAPYNADLDSVGNPNEIVPNCRLNGEKLAAKRCDISYQDTAPIQSISPALLFVPSFNRDAGKRLTMATNAIIQARQPIIRERTWCATGMEAVVGCGYQTARSILEICMHELGLDIELITDSTEITLVDINDSFRDASSNAISYGTALEFVSNLSELERFTYVINRLQPATNSSLKHQRVRFVPGGIYGIDDIVVIDNDMDDRKYTLSRNQLEFGKEAVSLEKLSDCALAIGNNVRVLFQSFEGAGYEDSVVASESFSKMYGLATLDIIRIQSDAVTSIGEDDDPRKEYFSKAADQEVSALSHLDTSGLAIIGTKIKPGQVVISKVTERDGATSTESVRASVGQDGVVINRFLLTKKNSAKRKIVTANVVIGKIRFLEVGDKVSGLHGNKGTIGKIVPDEDMPYSKQGQIDIILNPLGIISRTNIGQTVEAVIGAVGAATNTIQFLPPFSTESIGNMLDQAKIADVEETVIYDGRTGREYDRKAFVGTMYFLRSSHTSTSKYNACGLTDVKRNNVSLQPIRGQGGGQRIGEMFANALRGHNATKVLDSFFTTQSDDQEACKALVKAIETKTTTNIKGTYNNHKLFLAYFRSLGINVSVDTDGTNRFTPVTDDDINTLSLRKITIDMLSGTNKHAAGTMFLRDTSFLSEYEANANLEKLKREVYTSLELPRRLIMPMIAANPTFLNMFIVRQKGKFKLMTTNIFKDILFQDLMLESCMFTDFPVLRRKRDIIADRMKLPHSVGGAEALMCIFRNYDLRRTVAVIEAQLKSLGVTNFTSYIDTQSFKCENLELVVEVENAEEAQSDSILDSVLQNSVEYSEDASPINPAEVEEPATETPKQEAVKITTDRGENGLSLIRSNIITFLAQYRVSDYFVSSILIPPIAYRPDFEGRIASPVDKQFISLIGKLKSYNANQSDFAFTQVYRELYWMVYRSEAMDKKDKTIFEMIISHDNKNSKIRDTLFAKRVLGSGRSVITVDSSLRIDETRLPLSIATTIAMVMLLADRSTAFPNLDAYRKAADAESSRKVFNQLFTCLANDNIREFRDLLHLSNKNYLDLKKIFDICREELKARLEQLFQVYPVILCREPALHKLSGQAFWAKISDGYSIQLHPLACAPYNADFDGDQMGVYVSFVGEAVDEIKEKMMQHNNLIDPKNGRLVVKINQDMILGLYWMTMLASNQVKIKDAPIKKVYSIGGGMTKLSARNKIARELDAGRLLKNDLVGMIEEDGQQSVCLAVDAEYSMISERFNERYNAYEIISGSQLPRDGVISKWFMDDTQEDFTAIFREFDATGYRCMAFQEIWNDIDNCVISPQDFIIATIGGRNYCTTAGRILFSSILPDGCGFLDTKEGAFYKLRFDEIITSKKISDILDFVQKGFFESSNREIERQQNVADENKILDSSNREFARVLDRVKDVGFYMADISGITLSLFDFKSFELSKGNMLVQREVIRQMQSCKNASEALRVLTPFGPLLQRLSINKLRCDKELPVVKNLDHILVALNSQMTTPYAYVRMHTSVYRGICTIAQAYLWTVLGEHTAVPLTLTTVRDAIAGRQDSIQVAVDFTRAIVNLACKLSINMQELLDTSFIASASSQILQRRMGQIAKKFKDGRLTETLRRNLILKATEQYKSYVADDIDDVMTCSRNSNLFIMVDSGARGTRGQLMEICGFIGVTTDGQGNPIPSPIEGNLLNGLDPQELFLWSYHARSILVDTQLDIPHSGELNRQLTYLTEFLKIRNETAPEEIACSAESVEIPLTWEPVLPEEHFAICISEDEIGDLGRFPGWQEFIRKYFALNGKFMLTQRAIQFIKHYADSPEILLYPGNVQCQVSELKEGMELFVGLDNEFTRMFRNEFIKACDVSARVKQLLSEGLITELPVWRDNMVCAVPIRYKLCKRSYQMLYYRSIDTVKLPPEVAALAQHECVHRYEHNESNQLIASIISDRFLKALEEQKLYVDSIPIYTLANCECENGICRRCFGMKYDTSRIPLPGELVGFTGVQSVCSTISQMILDSHKVSGSGSKANEEISRIQELIDKEETCELALKKSIEVLVENVYADLSKCESMDDIRDAVERHLRWNPLRILTTEDVIVDVLSGSVNKTTTTTQDAEEFDVTESLEDVVLGIWESAIESFISDFISGDKADDINTLSMAQELKSVLKKYDKLQWVEVLDNNELLTTVVEVLHEWLPALELDYTSIEKQIGISGSPDLVVDYGVDIYFRAALVKIRELLEGTRATQEVQACSDTTAIGLNQDEIASRLYATVFQQSSGYALTRFLKMHVWLGLIELLETKSVLARNLEQFSKVLASSGRALADNFDEHKPIVFGDVYPVRELIARGVDFEPVKVTARGAIGYNGQIYADAFLNNTKQALIQHLLRGDNGVESTVGKCITGGHSVLKVDQYDFGVSASDAIEKVTNLVLDAEPDIESDSEVPDIFSSLTSSEEELAQSSAQPPEELGEKYEDALYVPEDEAIAYFDDTSVDPERVDYELIDLGDEKTHIFDDAPEPTKMSFKDDLIDLGDEETHIFG